MVTSLKLSSVGNVGRKLRNPVHNWQVRNKPFTLQPICFAPVLPGETLKNALFQARVVTEPIKNPLVGWWVEYYWFYVKHRDLANGSLYQSMMINPGTSMAAAQVAAAELKMFRSTNQIDWQGECVDRIVAEYFRGEGDAPADVDGLPVVGVNGNSLFDSAMLSSALATNDFNVDLNANATITASEVERALSQWEFLKANNLMTMSYEDFLRTYGVKVEDPDFSRPELLRYIREWSYPVNTVEPTTGVPSSAVSWAVSERLDKDRFFKEPGFIVGLTCCRPKVYFSLQRTAGINLLSDAYRWLPALMRNDPATSLARLASNATDSIITTTANAEFVLDVRDLFLYGDQFVNFDVDGGTANGSHVAMPTVGLERRYPVLADIDGLFVGATPTALVNQDGVARFSILGTVQEETPRGSATGIVM
jgi:hypothetical protein